MKKATIFLLALLFSFAFSSCTNNETDKSETLGTEETTISETVKEKTNFKGYEKFGFDANKKSIVYKELPYFGYLDAFSVLENELNEKYYDNYGDENYNPLEDDDYDESDYEEYFKGKESLDFSKAETQFYNSFVAKKRTVGDFVITDFGDGVCINKYNFDKKKFKKTKEYRTPITIEIPSELDGKKVLKLGEYVECDEDDYGYGDTSFSYFSRGFLTTIPDDYQITLKIPSTVTDITASALESIDVYRDDFFYSSGYISDIEVDNANANYTSKDGVMYSKNMEWMLFFRPDPNSDYDNPQVFTVPDSVKYIADTNLCETRIDPSYTMKIGNNVKKIYAHIRFGDCGTTSCNFEVEKGSAAEKWLKKEDY